jgi:5-methylcytosine-specific restriction endonuclease McrA
MAYKTLTCKHCGEDLDSLRYDDQNNECAYCGTDLDTAKVHLDHMTPLSRGGEHVLNNLQYTCKSCNCRKETKTHEEYLEFIS